MEPESTPLDCIDEPSDRYLTPSGHQVIRSSGHHPLTPSGHQVIRSSSPHALAHVVPHAAGAPFAEPLTYTLPEALRGEVAFGSLVLAPLGSRELVGVVVGFPADAPADLSLKPIRAVLDPEPVFDEHLYEVATWIAARCHCSLDEALQPIMPEGHLIGAARVIQLTPDWPDDAEAPARWGRTTRSLAARLRSLLLETGGQIELSVLKRRLPSPGLTSLIQQARRRGWIEEEYRLSRPRVRARTVPAWSLAADSLSHPLTLSPSHPLTPSPPHPWESGSGGRWSTSRRGRWRS